MTTEQSAPTLADYATHSPYSDPGAHRALVADLATDPAAIQRAACSVVVHYRSGAPALTERQREDIDSRWLATTLALAQERQPGSLDVPRALAHQVAGCCRDHSLFALGVLREHGIPARSRVGFAGYFTPGFRHDHVVVERWWTGADHAESEDAGRWVRSDPELEAGAWDFDVHDMPTGPGTVFESAAEAWQAIRSGAADPATYGVDASLPHLGGKDFVRDYVLLEVAHRHRDELLLWDLWGPMLSAGFVPDDAVAALGSQPGSGLGGDAFDTLIDEIAALLVAADAGDPSAADELARRYATDLRPGPIVATMSPYERVGVTDLVARTTGWR